MLCLVTFSLVHCRFFGGFGFGGFGGGEEEEQIPKGNDVYVELEVTLTDLYLGNSFKVPCLDLPKTALDGCLAAKQLSRSGSVPRSSLMG